MNTHHYIRALLATLLGLSVLVPAVASAQNVGTSAAVNAQATTTIRTELMTRAILRADQEIDRRIEMLKRFNTRIQEMRKVSAEFKQNLKTNVENHISGLTTLKAKIDAASDAEVLKADVLTIRQAYRIFALLMPQAAIAAAADRIVVVIDMMVGVGNKLQTRIDAAAQAGADVAALTTALTELGTTLSTAQTEAQSAVNASASLSPDNGEASVMASNAAALKAARTDLQDARAALVKARQSINTIVQGLRSLNSSVNASSSVEVQ